MKVLLTATVQSHICQFHKPLVEILHKYGYEVHVAAKDNLAEKNGLKLDFVDKIYDIPFARSPKNKVNVLAYKKLKEIIDKENYNIIHCNTPMGGILTRLAARKARKLGTKVYYTAHGFHFYEGAPIKNWLLFYPIEKIFSKITDKIITITKEDYQLAKNKFYCKIERIHGVGVDEKRFYTVSEKEQLEIREKFNLKKEQKIILCVGELLPNKNQKMIIQAMEKVIEKYPETQLLIAGNGPEKENLEKLIRNLKLEENIKMLGYVTNLQEYQKIADIAVSCSKREGLPLNIVEAMLSGTPVIASLNRGHRELIHDGENGFIVDIDDSKKMAEKILKLFENKKLFEQIKEKAELYAEKYTFKNVKKELIRIYGFKDE